MQAGGAFRLAGRVGLALLLAVADVVVATPRAHAWVTGPATVAAVTGVEIDAVTLGGPDALASAAVAISQYRANRKQPRHEPEGRVRQRPPVAPPQHRGARL